MTKPWSNARKEKARQAARAIQQADPRVTEWREKGRAAWAAKHPKRAAALEQSMRRICCDRIMAGVWGEDDELLRWHCYQCGGESPLW